MNGAQVGSLIPLALIVLAFWFLVLRPARGRTRATRTMQQQLSVGETVMLTSGVYGRIAGLTDNEVQLRVAPQVVIAVHRNAVGRVLTDEDEARMRSAGIFDSAGDPAAEPVD